MVIHFCYIEGISDIDTPYFEYQVQQASFMEDRVVSSIDTTFYPPHYTNRIIVDIEDVNFITSVNYCYFEFDGKPYYYFIDNIEYLSEDTIAVDIRMDTVQTYYFNIYVQDAYIEREHIKRWYNIGTTWYINRNYIRENVSDGEFDITNRHTLSATDDNRLWLCIKVYDSPALLSKYCSEVYYTSSRHFTVPYGYFILPTRVDKIRYKNNNTTTDITVDYNMVINLLTDNKIIDFYVLKRNPYNDKTWIHNDGTGVIFEYIDTSVTVNAEFYGSIFTRPNSKTITYIDNIAYGSCDVKRRLEPNYDDNIPIQRNTNINTDLVLLEQYEIGLIDENYYRITYGDIDNVTTIPTHRVDNSYYTCYTLTDFDNGADVYYIEIDDDYDINDNYFDSAISSNNKFSMQLLNDAYKEYAANNGNRWLVAGLKTATNVMGAFSIAAGGYSYTSGFEKTNIISKLSRKTGKVSERITNKTVGAGRTYSPAEGKVGSDMIEGIAPLVSQGLSDLNARMSPASLRNTGNAVTDLLCLHLYTYHSIYKVRDYKQCAWYYQRYGYKVNRFVSNVDNIFNEVNKRFYFNILKLSDSNIHLHNIIEDDTNVTLIKERLENGIRLWNFYLGKNTSDTVDVPASGDTTVNVVLGNRGYIRFETNNSNVEITSYAYSVVYHRWTVNLHNNTNTLQTCTVTGYLGYGGDRIGNYQYENVEKDFIE